MYRSSFATLLVAVVLCATLSVAAVSEFQKSEVRPARTVVPESVFDDVAADESVLQIAQVQQPSIPPLPQSKAKKKAIVRSSSSIRLENYQDWRQAGAVDDSENRSHQIRLTSDGMLPGRIVLFNSQSGLPQPVVDVSVFFLKMNIVSTVVKPGPNGVFQATGLIPGVYGVAVLGKEALALYTVHVLPTSDEKGKDADLDSLRLEIAAIPASDAPLALSIFQPYLDQGSPPVPTELDDDNIPAGTKVTDKVADSPKGTTTRKHGIALQADGSLIGRIRRLHPTSGHPFLLHSSSDRVYFVQNNKVVYRAAINQEGFFKIPNFTPGAYSAITAGEDGVGAIGCRILAAEVNAKQPDAKQIDAGKVTQFMESAADDKIEFVSFLLQGEGGSAPEFDITLLGPENFEILKQLLTPAELDALLGGGFPGGTGGGGGGAGSGLPLELLGLLGLLGLESSP